MKKILFGTAIVLSCIACKDKANETTTAQNTNTATNNTATTTASTTTQTATNATKPATIADDFRTLRDAIFNKQKETVASYFTFPIKEGIEEMWMLCEKETKTEMSKDEFIKNFDKIFFDDFVKALQKVKSEDLFNKGSFDTPDFNSPDRSFNLGTTYDKANKTLRLNHHAEEGDGQSTITYEFNASNGKLKFKRLFIAG